MRLPGKSGPRLVCNELADNGSPQVLGAALTQSPVIIFMESHCVMQPGWLEPLLEALAQAHILWLV